jgi:hypothetical protein
MLSEMKFNSPPQVGIWKKEFLLSQKDRAYKKRVELASKEKCWTLQCALTRRAQRLCTFWHVPIRCLAENYEYHPIDAPDVNILSTRHLRFSPTFAV